MRKTGELTANQRNLYSERWEWEPIVMGSEESISRWIRQLKTGDQRAAQQLWQRYFEKLVHLAQKKLKGARRRVADEEDVALSAFDSFCRGAQEARFPQLNDRNNLWAILVVITARKAIKLTQREKCQKRGGGAVRGESVLIGPASNPISAGWDQFLASEPTPQFLAQVTEECNRRLEKLPSPELRSVATWKMEGYTNQEIAEKLGCVAGTVERKLRVIRSLWERELP